MAGWEGVVVSEPAAGAAEFDFEKLEAFVAADTEVEVIEVVVVVAVGSSAVIDSA